LFNNYKTNSTNTKESSLPFENLIKTNKQVSLLHNINIPKYLYIKNKNKNYKCPIG